MVRRTEEQKGVKDHGIYLPWTKVDILSQNLLSLVSSQLFGFSQKVESERKLEVRESSHWASEMKEGMKS